MSDLIKIAVDAMGGDGSPEKIIEGILLNHKSNKNNFFKIFGDKPKIEKIIDSKIEKNFLKSYILKKLLEILTVLWRLRREEKILVCGLQ